MMHPRLRRVLLRRLVVLVALAVACAKDATGPATVASVQVTPPNAQAQIGATVQLFAMPRDANGNELPGRAITWSSANSAVATVDGNGVVTGAALGAVQITATSEGTSGQATVSVIPGSATALVFTVAPGNVVAGIPFTPALQVTARDAFGNAATGFTGAVTLALGANPGGAALTGTTTVAAVAGVANFAGVSLDKSGVGYTLQASAGGLPAVASGSFAVSPAAATHLVFSVQPGTTVAGATIAPALQVTARDAFANTATGFTGAVTIALGANPTGATLSGTTTVNAVSGVAIFGTLSVDRNGTGYTLSTTAAGLSGATSAPFSITAGSVSASLSTVVAAPATITASTGSSASNVTVTARDTLGNPIGGVTVVLAATGGGTTVTQPGPTDASGVATGTVSATVAGVKTISATAGGVAIDQTATVTVDPDSTAQLAFAGQPTPTSAGSPITPAVQVSARDAFGNVATTFSGNVSIAIGTNPGGGTLSGTTTAAAVSGVATFSNLSIDKTGTGYTLTAAAAGLSGATSAAFAITPGPATHLVCIVPPTTTVAGATITPPVQVAALDAFDNTATGFTGVVTAVFEFNAGGGTLGGTTSVSAVAGVATFANLSVDNAGAGYTLVVTAPGLGSVTCGPFTVTAAAPSTLVPISGNAQTDTIGATLAAPYVVRVTDTFGNGVSGVTVTWAVTGGDGSITPSSATDATGHAQAIRLLGNTVGAQTATASVGGLAGSPLSFTATAGPGNPSQLAFTVQPGTTTAGVAIAPAVQVTARDRIGTTTTGFTGDMTIAIGDNPAGGTLSGTATVAAVAGAATFSSVSIDKAGAGYTLAAAAAGLAGATSAPFSITASAVSGVQSTVTAAPATIAASTGTSQSTITVTARDALGNPVGGAAVVLAASGSGNTITQPAGLTDASGVATGTISSTAAGPKTVSATAAGVAITQAPTVTVIPTAATQLEFTVEPGTTTAGAAFSPAVQVTAWDAFGNTATGFSGTVTVAIGNDPPGTGVLDGTASVAAVLGVATFPDLDIDEAGPGYTLTASAAGVSGATSGAFDVTAGPAATIALVSGDAQTDTVGATLALPYVVRVSDALGNGVSGVTVAWAVTSGGGTITPSSVTNATGQALASRVLGNTPGAQTATATVAGLAGSPVGFTATADPGNTTQLAFTVQPITTVAGSPITPAVQVAAHDRLGNTTPDYTGDVTVAIGTNPAGGTLSGTTIVAAVAGVATFSSLDIDKAGAGYTLTAAASGLTGATSSGFSITAGPATQLAFTVQPSSTSAGVTITPAVQVTARDAFGNTATGYAGTVTVAIGTNPPGTGVLDGTASVAAVLGVATFPGLNIDEAGTGYTLTANAAGVSGAVSSAFDVTVGAAATLALVSGTAQTDTVGATLALPYVVRVADAVGNGVSGVTVAWAATGGGGTITPSSVTDATGQAQATRVLGDTPGAHTATATGAGLAGSPVSFTATAQPGNTTQLAFTVQPVTTAAGAAVTPAAQVTARDRLGNTATGYTGSVTVAIGTNPAGGTLSGTTSVAAAAGVATFSNLSIDSVGTGYTLTASATGLAGTTSAAFDIVTNISATLSTLVSATDTVGQCLKSCALGLDASRITVTVRDQSGNPLAGVSVTLSASPADSVLFVNPGASGTTNGSGVFAADFRSVRAVSRTISAEASGVTLTQTATVHVMPVLVGAGDIATCTLLSDDAVASLLDSIPGTVFTLGDNAYPDGTAAEFTNCYDPTWGRHLARTRAVAGNRDYNTPGAAGHYDYFGAAANPSGGTGNDAGFYSFDLGAWHIVSLNTEVATASNSAQFAWLLQDLNGRSNQCVIAMWHKPMFASSSGGSGSAVPLWQLSADSGVEIVLNGHSHVYERLVPLDATGNPSATGVRTFIVGTGGIGLGGFATDPPYSAVRDKTTHGVLRIVLYPDRYRWQFIPAPGFGSFTDSGTANCN